MDKYLILPQPEDIRAARVRLDWKQKVLADKCKVHLSTITAIERGNTKPRKELLEKISKVFYEQGIFFLPNGGYRVDKNIVTVYQGESSFINLQNDILNTYKFYSDFEVLYLGGDDARSSNQVIEKDREMYKRDIIIKNIINKETNYILGPKEQYRQVSSKYLLNEDVITIYGTKVCFSICITHNPYTSKIIVIDDQYLALNFKKYFYLLWNTVAKKVKTSSCKQICFYQNHG